MTGLSSSSSSSSKIQLNFWLKWAWNLATRDFKAASIRVLFRTKLKSWLRMVTRKLLLDTISTKKSLGTSLICNKKERNVKRTGIKGGAFKNLRLVKKNFVSKLLTLLLFIHIHFKLLYVLHVRFLLKDTKQSVPNFVPKYDVCIQFYSERDAQGEYITLSEFMNFA